MSLFTIDLKLLFPKFFRCPYGKYAERHNQVLNILWEKDSTARLASARKAFTEFYTNTKLSVLTITMPEEFHARCKTIKDIKREILPYQCDILALQLDLRLYPFLNYQYTEEATDKLDQSVPARVYYHKKVIARLLQQVLSEEKLEDPKNATDLSLSLYKLFRLYSANITCPAIVLPGRNPGDSDETDLVRLFAYTADFLYEYDSEFCWDPLRNQNLYGFVTCPFYPKEFGRYSETIQMIFTRESDNTRIGEEERKILRTQSNTILRNAGIHVPLDENEEETYVPEGGVWIPKYN